jgi:gas vesicle protein
MVNGQNRIIGLGLSFLAGCVVGGIAGLLAAPQSGARTRRQLAHYADDLRERAGGVTEDTTAAIHRMVEKGRTLVCA